ncbi:MAG TPA: helix-turn-helix domain-containing protein [Candidatus Angelobacter sp.]|nr:helix-turn-helix domain-containing protein [Candidatus Angelobacter sp.]
MELKSKREAAEMLSLSTRGVERAVQRGQLTVHYRDSKHGKTAWFAAHEIERLKQVGGRGAVGFTSGIPSQPPGAPQIGALIPMVEIEPRQRKGHDPEANVVALADRLVLRVDEVAQLSGLPRNFILENIRKGRLKAITIGRRHYVKRSELNEFVHQL